MAFIDFVTQNKALNDRTVDADYGCAASFNGVTKLQSTCPRRCWKHGMNAAAIESSVFRFLQDNKQDLLRLVSIEELIRAETDVEPTT